MEIMRDTLHQASLENARGEEFIPRNRIYASMNERSVKKVLLERNVRRQDISDLVNIVLHKALRTFAILVCIRRPELLLEFVYNDQLQSSDLDHQLPYEIEKLQNILSDSVAPKYLWKEFYTEQWRFTAPVFDGSIFKRVLHRKSRLPYLIDQPIDEEQEGAYGRISQVEIEPSHRLFNGSQVMVCASSVL